MKILVVDDEQVVLTSCQRVLEAEGFEVALVPSVTDVLAALENNNFSLLLIDVKMPEHNGMYLMEVARERWLQIPTIIMSGYDTAETVHEAARKGASTFIAKPFTPDELLETVRQDINRKG